MIVLQVNNVSKSFGANPILSDIRLEIKADERIALVGRNGAGKSTLLKIITGELAYDSGEIIIPKEIEIGYLSQQTGIDSKRTIWQEMMTVFQPLKVMEKKLREMELKMGDPDLLADRTAYDKLMMDYDKLQNEFKNLGGYRYEADIRSVLHGLKFSEFHYDETIVSTLSGGQKTRLSLAKLLLKKPPLLILDEPTNHLDIETLSWLENHLQSYPGAILIVSHDRYFLDKIVTAVYELSRGRSLKYVGNYSQYVIKKAERYEKELKAYTKQQAEITQMEEFIQKNLARASTTKRAQSRRKQLEKIKRLDKPAGDKKSAHFSFSIDRESGNNVLEIKDLSVSYGDEPVFSQVNLRASRQNSIALVGPNGIGKSTLLKAIIKKVPYKGSIHLGTNVTIGYYDQEQANLVSNKTVIQELWDDFPTMKEKEIRTILGNFLFSGDDVFKHVSELSGGEKARLALAKLMLQKANFLILDEPTNHLDIDSKEMLENALIEYPGTILFVSHDRYFINRLATNVVELAKDGITDFLGDYDYYVEKKNELNTINEQKEDEHASHNVETQPQKNHHEIDKSKKRLERKRLRRSKDIEDSIERKEQIIHELEKQLSDPSVYQDYKKVAEVNVQITKTREEIELLFLEWEKIQKEMNDVT